jgi:hypothetical protein
LDHFAKYFLLLFIFFVFVSGCKRNSTSNCFKYPAQIDSLQVRDLYDTARWYLYSWLCDEKVDDFYRAECELRYKSFFLRNDSIELFFTFYFPNKGQKDDRERYCSSPSVAFNTATKKKLWAWDINGFSNGLQPGNERFENPKSREVLKFISTNRNKLNPCFLELAKKLNVLNE